MTDFVQGWRIAARVLDAVNWSLVLILLAFGWVEWFALVGTAPAPAPAVNPGDPAHVAYAAAVAAAAIKQPSFRVELKTIPATMTTVTVVSFGPPGEMQPEPRPYDIWASLPEQLRSACKGAADPTRRLQQILGMPPVAAPDHVVRELQVSRDALLRPCLAGGDLASAYCDFPVAPASSANGLPPATAAPVPSRSAARPPPAVVSARPLTATGVPASSLTTSAPPAPSGSAIVLTTGPNRAYDELYFLTAQLWNSYRGGFAASGRVPGDYLRISPIVDSRFGAS